MNWIDYREQLGIGFDEDKKLEMCKNRLGNITQQLSDYYTEDNLFLYANTVGMDCGFYTTRNTHPLRFVLGNVLESFSLKELIAKYVALINSAKEVCLTESGNMLSQLFETALTGTLDAFRIPYDIIRDSDGVFIFPKGVKELDDELVSHPLQWLSRYPEIEKAWGKALRAYSNGGEPSEIADQFRKALERFFQNFFQSDKSLENLKADYGRYLKDNGIPGDIVANFECLLQQYTTFMNNYAKHHDRTSNTILEYIMYQTGNIMRLLIILSDQEQE